MIAKEFHKKGAKQKIIYNLKLLCDLCVLCG